MAVPQNKKSRSRTRILRSRAALRAPTLSEEKGGKGPDRGLGELRRRHHIGADGIYRGVQYFVPKTGLVEAEED